MSLVVPGTEARAFSETRDLTPWAIEEYLALSGWTREETQKGIFGVWGMEKESASLLLPYDRSLRDFTRRYGEALDTLTAVTGLEGEALALEIVAARKDIFLLRADQDTRDGSIPFLEARRLIEGVQTLLTSAAATTIRPRASTAGNKPAIVNEFMRDDVRMGHTLRGSFVLTVLAADATEEAKRRARWRVAVEGSADTHPEEQVLPTTDDESMTSFPRMVMSTLAIGLQTAQEMLHSPSTAISIDDAVAAGVTLQMLESVENMAKSEGLRELDMAFRWAKVEAKHEELPDRVQLSRDQAQGASSYIERFSKQPDREDDYILGQVVRLDRPEGSEEGQVVVDGFVGKARRRVKVPLSGEAYRMAIAAHDASQPVTVTGTFTRSARGWRFEGEPILSLVGLSPTI